jgi:hypothetical protein
VTAFGNARRHGARVEANAGYHIWDMRDGDGRMGAAACVVVPWFADRYEKGEDWRQLAWWIHDHLPYGHLEFYPKLCAFNIQWSEQPRRRIDSFIAPKGCLTRPGMPNHTGDHSSLYPALSATACSLMAAEPPRLTPAVRPCASPRAHAQRQPGSCS